jgi:hypothetical protein
MIVTAPPAPKGYIARLVDLTEMPGAGGYFVARGERIGPESGWNSLNDAVAAVRELTAGDEIASAGIFKNAGRFEAAALTYRHVDSNSDQPLHAWSDSIVGRTVSGRSLVQIVDGDSTPEFADSAAFRYYWRQANSSSGT